MVQLNRAILVDEDDVKKGANITTVGAINAQNMLLRNSSGVIIDAFGGGVQYTEGDTDATITGNAIMWEGPGDALNTVTQGYPLPIDIRKENREMLGILHSYNSNLTANEVKTWYDSTQYSDGSDQGYRIFIYADQPSATDGFEIQVKIQAGTTYYTIYKKTIEANIPYSFLIERPATAVQIKYTNGSTATTLFNFEWWYTRAHTIGITKNGLQQIEIAGMTPLPAGANNIGDVDVLSLPSIPAGNNIIGKIGHDITTIGDGRKTVATAGTREALAVSTSCEKVDITAEIDNTGIIVVGGSTVVAALATRRGIPLYAGDTYSFEIDNLADIYIDATVSGDGCTYTYFSCASMS